MTDAETDMINDSIGMPRDDGSMGAYDLPKTRTVLKVRWMPFVLEISPYSLVSLEPCALDAEGHFLWRNVESIERMFIPLIYRLDDTGIANTIIIIFF